MVSYSMELVEETFELHVFDNFKCYWNWFFGGGGIMQKKESPDFSFPEVGISKVASHELRFNCIINLLLWHFFL